MYRSAGPPKCLSCFVSNAPMPFGANIPLQTPPQSTVVLPCGCDYEDAFMEYWMVSIGIWNATQANGRIAVSHFNPLRSKRSFSDCSFSTNADLYKGNGSKHPYADVSSRAALYRRGSYSCQCELILSIHIPSLKTRLFKIFRFQRMLTIEI